ncbi:hypothetical protein ABPG75_009617 [Micractinium tetrahymenae]
MAEPQPVAATPVPALAPGEQAPASAKAAATPAQQAMPALSPTTPTAVRARPSGGRAGATSAAAGIRRRLEERRGLPSSAYLSMAAACLAMALLLLAAPGVTARLMFNKHYANPIDAQHTILLRLLGGASFVGAAAAAAIASGSWGGDGERSADLAKLALLGQGLANALTFAYYSNTIHRLNLPAELVVNGACALLPAMDLLSTGRYRGLLSELGRRLAAPPAGAPLLAVAHYTLAVLFPLSGVALFYFPHTALYHFFGYSYGASTFLLSKLAGVVDKALMPVLNLLLKDAADRAALRSRAARLLNTGQLLCALVHIATLLPYMAREGGGWMLPMNLATWVLAFVTSAAGLVVGASGRAGSSGQPSMGQPTLAEPAAKAE